MKQWGDLPYSARLGGLVTLLFRWILLPILLSITQCNRCYWMRKEVPTGKSVARLDVMRWETLHPVLCLRH